MDNKKKKSWGQLSKRQQYRRLKTLMEADSLSESEDGLSFTDPTIFTDDYINRNLHDKPENDLKRELGTRFLLSAASKRFAGEILEVLRNNQDISRVVKLPKDPRSLLGVPKNTPGIFKVDGGEMTYFGVQNSVQLLKIDNDEPYVQIDIGIDGVSPFNKSTTQLWPIMGSYKNQVPFMIGCFVGKSKPSDECNFLRPLVEEVAILLKNGIKVGTYTKAFKIRCICVDAMGRALICGTRYPTAANGCPFCDQLGEMIGHVMNYRTDIVEERTNETFRERKHANFHRCWTPLEMLQIDIINQIPLCSLHLLDLGVGRRLLFFYIKTCMNPQMRQIFSTRLDKIKSYITNDFDGKTKSFKELMYFKGHDFRRFLLYEGPVILKGLIDDDYYNNFLLIHVAYRLICMPSERNLDCADKLIRRFVRQFPEFFGDNVTYNVHCLLHFLSFVRLYGEPTNFSTYKFENTYQVYKKVVKSGSNVLKQIINFEILRRENINYTSEKKSYYDNNELTNQFPNNYYLLEDNSIFILKKIEGNLLTGTVCKVTESLYTYPFDSKNLSIFKVKRQNFRETVYATKNYIKAKILLLPESSSTFAAIPILHTYEN